MTKPSLIDRLDAWLRANRADYYKKLRPGANGDQLAAAAKVLGVAMPPSLATFFRWRSAGISGRLQENWGLLDLEDVTGWHEDFAALAAAGDLAPGAWQPAWIPFLGDGGGNYLCVDAATGALVTFRHDDAARTIEYPSFDAWLETLVVTLEAGAWRVEASGFVEPNAKKLAAARAKLAPAYPKRG